MKISLNWARHWTKVPEYTPESLESFSHTYSTYTAEVEGIDSYVFDDRIVVGKILAWKPHPDSDKLGLVEVDAGKSGKHEIVCGAPNAKTSNYAPIALENAKLPGGLVIARRPIRGIDSCGMICSLDELGLQAERAEGIFPLETVWSEDTLEGNLGEPFGSLTLSLPGHRGEIVYPMNDVVFDLDNKFITNRPDLFSVVGNAREIACIEKAEFSKVDILSQESSNELSVKVESDKVINYLLQEYTLPSLPESPFLVQTLLLRSNQGTHGLLPDLTNIVMTEIGQPMHVFDADTISGNIVLRMAKEGEKFKGLDDKEYILTSADLVIVDDREILALAGIMGGKSSAASVATKRIYVESATFDPVTVRKTSQRLGLRTDSSMRFEKGVDKTLPHLAQTRYAELLTHFIPEATLGQKTVITTSVTVTQLNLSLEFLSKKIGVEVSADQVENILTRLGFLVTFNDQRLMFNVLVPSWRDTGDISISEDIVEEVARHIGYETIHSAALPGPLETVHVMSHDPVTGAISRFFANRGYYDAYTYPFTLSERFAKFSDATPAVIHNTSENRTHLRAHMAENLLELVASHYRSRATGGFFEFGPIFDGEESLQGLGVLWGKKTENLQSDLAGYMQTFFGNAGSITQGSGDTKLFAPHAYGEFIDSSDEVTVRFGLVRPTLLPMYDIDDLEVYAFEIVKMPELHRPVKFTPLVEFPGTEREFNFILPEETPVAEVIQLVKNVHPWISNVGVSEIYRDETHIGRDKKSVVVSLLIRNDQATIVDAEALAIQESIVSTLAEAGYPLRGA